MRSRPSIPGAKIDIPTLRSRHFSYEEKTRASAKTPASLGKGERKEMRIDKPGFNQAKMDVMAVGQTSAAIKAERPFSRAEFKYRITFAEVSVSFPLPERQRSEFQLTAPEHAKVNAISP
ncbi:uncharacterized protein MYCFIDRAFT_172193 [Pseudocercospora fijiensis CIRAD86]|uniref:Uncharacterized protein n=1 Tax=Pseudocercospora fijiensis (strain CIRAD86) TaxID=383855 RepID=M3APA6_PSEFD|nr:uncharacterized protein MYCFIDRAFT_172193 [Pseudocercospora fijiensis CIRAD86]EME86441.1 hypothetical protein MYCFIDRAFT_172193 [Pseudocercospora fijiensis CIRAD86]